MPDRERTSTGEIPNDVDLFTEAELETTTSEYTMEFAPFPDSRMVEPRGSYRVRGHSPTNPVENTRTCVGDVYDNGNHIVVTTDERVMTRNMTRNAREYERQRQLVFEAARSREHGRQQQQAEAAQACALQLDWSRGCQCDGCNARTARVARNRNMFNIDRQAIVDASYFVCVGCRQACPQQIGRYGRRTTNIQILVNHHTICNSCRANPNIVFCCDLCSSTSLTVERTQDSLTGQNWCDSCHAVYGTDGVGRRMCRCCESRYNVNEVAFDARGECQHCRRRNLIRPYDDDVLRHCRMVGQPKDRIFLGVELEVEPTSIDRLESAERLQNAIRGFGILKRDGSLSENGIEIVSTPIAFDKFYSGMWDDFFKEETLEGLRSAKTETCGMHVHVSRAPLTKLQIGKIVAFIHNPANAPFIEVVSQRPSNYYGDFRQYKTETEVLRDVSDRNNRYTALNLRNPHTIEFRIFKGTINRTTFFKNIEFCHALVKYCGGTARSLGEAVNQQLFSAYVFQERKTYPHLWQFLVRRGFCPSFKNVHELSSFVESVGSVARKQYLDERAKNRLANGLITVRSRDMNFYRGVDTTLRGGTITGRISSGLRHSSGGGWSFYDVSPRTPQPTEVYDAVRNHERDEILNTLGSNQIEFEDVPTPENSPEYNVWGTCDCSYCGSASEQERQYEQERLQMLRERYNAFCNVEAEPEVESLSDLLDSYDYQGNYDPNR